MVGFIDKWMGSWEDNALDKWSRQNGRLFASDISKYIFLNEYDWILIEIALAFVPNGVINIISALVQIMAWLVGWLATVVNGWLVGWLVGSEATSEGAREEGHLSTAWTSKLFSLSEE